MPFVLVAFLYKIKYTYLLNLLTITNIKLYTAYIISFFNFSSLIIKLNKTIFYSLFSKLISFIRL